MGVETTFEVFDHCCDLLDYLICEKAFMFKHNNIITSYETTIHVRFFEKPQERTIVIDCQV